ERLVASGQAHQGAEDQAMVVTVEVRFTDQLGDPFPCGVLQHHTTEYSLFGFDGMGWDLQCSGLEVQLGTLGVNLITHGTGSILDGQASQKTTRRCRRTSAVLASLTVEPGQITRCRLQVGSG